MKRCPTCERTFEDSFSFCLIDGAVLSAPFDSEKTLAIAEPEKTAPARTEQMPAPVPVNQEKSDEETLPAKPPSAYQTAPSPAPVTPVKKGSRLPLVPLVIAGVVALSAIGIAVLLVAAWAGRSIENQNGAKGATTNGAQTAANKNQSNASDAAPKATPSSVINLEGTVWRDSAGGLHKFIKGGKLLNPDPNIVCNWTQEEEKVYMRCPPAKDFVGSKDYGTIKGDRMDGYSIHDNGERDNWVFFRVKK